MAIGKVGQTITLTLHRDKCDPAKWTVHEWKLFADFVRTGELSYGASLARLGLQPRLDDRHEPTGGTLECVGWVTPDDLDGSSPDLGDIVDEHATPVEVCRLYRGPTEYAVQYAVGHDDEVDGYEVDTFDTLDEATKFAKSLTRDLVDQT